MYLLLLGGSLTMILPLLVTVTGSMCGTYDLESSAMYPRFSSTIARCGAASWMRAMEAP